MNKIRLACIIDDDPIFVRVVKKMMEMADFSEQVSVFPNGQIALDGLQTTLEDQYPDIIFLDLNMPTLNGWGFLDAFDNLGLPESTLLYVVSSSIDPGEKERARSYPFVQDFIEKPLTINIIKQILSTKLEMYL